VPAALASFAAQRQAVSQRAAPPASEEELPSPIHAVVREYFDAADDDGFRTRLLALASGADPTRTAAGKTPTPATAAAALRAPAVAGDAAAAPRRATVAGVILRSVHLALPGNEYDSSDVSDDDKADELVIDAPLQQSASATALSAATAAALARPPPAVSPWLTNSRSDPHTLAQESASVPASALTCDAPAIAEVGVAVQPSTTIAGADAWRAHPTYGLDQSLYDDLLRSLRHFAVAHVSPSLAAALRHRRARLAGATGPGTAGAGTEPAVLTPRIAARLFHGLQSPAFPAQSWRGHRDWSQWIGVEFDVVRLAAARVFTEGETGMLWAQLSALPAPAAGASAVPVGKAADDAPARRSAPAATGAARPRAKRSSAVGADASAASAGSAARAGVASKRARMPVQPTSVVASTAPVAAVPARALAPEQVECVGASDDEGEGGSGRSVAHRSLPAPASSSTAGAGSMSPDGAIDDEIDDLLGF
jgi:hypothetical protein